MDQQDSRTHGRRTAALAQALASKYRDRGLLIFHDHRGDEEDDHGQIGEIVSWLDKNGEARGAALSQLDIAVACQEGNETKALVLMEIEETSGRPKTVLGDAFASLLGSHISFKDRCLTTDVETTLLLLVRDDEIHPQRLDFLEKKIASCRPESVAGAALIGDVLIRAFNSEAELMDIACAAIENSLSRRNKLDWQNTIPRGGVRRSTINLEDEFTRALWGTIEAAKKLHYVPTYFIQMIEEFGGRETARRLLAKQEPQAGLFELYHLGILNESMEAVICDNPQFHPLFSADEIREAHRRLEELDYFKNHNRSV